MTNVFAARALDDAHVEELEKYGMPPDVPEMVNAGVEVPVATDTMPPVQPTEVTVPVAAAVQDSAFPLASTPSGYEPAEQLVPLAASAVAVATLPAGTT
jgi:hypothetical protein